MTRKRSNSNEEHFEAREKKDKKSHAHRTGSFSSARDRSKSPWTSTHHKSSSSSANPNRKHGGRSFSGGRSFNGNFTNDSISNPRGSPHDSSTYNHHKSYSSAHKMPSFHHSASRKFSRERPTSKERYSQRDFEYYEAKRRSAFSSSGRQRKNQRLLVGVQERANVKLFHWKMNWRDCLPCIGSKSSENKIKDQQKRDEKRIIRKDLWNKYGRPMHFFTLEFQPDFKKRRKIDVSKAIISNKNTWKPVDNSNQVSAQGNFSTPNKNSTLSTAISRTHTSNINYRGVNLGQGGSNGNNNPNNGNQKNTWSAATGTAASSMKKMYEDDSEYLESQFAFDYMHRNKRAVEHGTFAMGIVLSCMLFSNFLERGYFDTPLNILAPFFFLQYIVSIWKREFFWSHFQVVIMACAMFHLSILAGWTVFVEPYYLPGHNKNLDIYLPEGDFGQPTQKRTWFNFILFILICMTIFRLRFAYLMPVVIYGLCLYYSFNFIMEQSRGCSKVNYNSFMTSRMNFNSRGVYNSANMGMGINDLSALNPLSDDCEKSDETVPQWKKSCLVIALLCSMAYTREILMRKDFIQANMAQKERGNTDYLLQSMLPKSVLAELKQALFENQGMNKEITIPAHTYPDVTILVAQEKTLSDSLDGVDAMALVKVLNHMFTIFDNCADANGVDRIKTNGSTYIACSGAPKKNKDHAKAMARFALQIVSKLAEEAIPHPAMYSRRMIAGTSITNISPKGHGQMENARTVLNRSSDSNGKPSSLAVRVGINSGTVLAGVIGGETFIEYDLFGADVTNFLNDYGVNILSDFN